jgi:outer membrane receptor protein involved in Fe transport
MKQSFILLMCILLSTIVMSQNPAKINFKLLGTLTDSVSQKGIPFATVSVFKMPGNVAYKRQASESDGSFVILIKDTGNYRISAQMIGYSLFTKEFTVNTNPDKLDLGKIIMAEAAEQIGEVSIVADKPLIKVDADKISYSAESDPESKTSNVLDMLRKVPLVTVDGEDNIQLKGASNFKIFINGKPSTMLSNNPKDVLKNMPANTVKDIEVITSPGSKYDAEGIGGIINIITQKKTVNGYTGSVNAGAGTLGNMNSSLYFASTLGKFGFSTNLSGNYFQSTKNRSETYRESYVFDANKYTYYKGYSSYRSFMPWGNGEASYEIDSLNLISASFNFWYGKPEMDNENTVTVLDAGSVIAQSYQMKSKNFNTFGSPEANIDFQHIFKRNKEQILTLSYKINHNPSDNQGESEYIPILNYYESIRKSMNDAWSNEQTFQVDYVHPLNKMQKIEGGSKYILRRSSSNSDNYIYDYDQNEFVNEMQGTSFDYVQKISAAYASYNIKFKKISFKTGLRIESAYTRGNISPNDTSFTNSSLEFVPNANLSYQVSPTTNYRLSYGLRLQRPGIWYLNPFVNRLDNKNINFGNPRLDPERFHSIDLSFSRFGKISNINLSTFYTFTNNAIDRYVSVVDSVTSTTYQNIGQSWSVGASLYGSLRFGAKFSINLNSSVNYKEIISAVDETISNSGWSGNISSNIQYSFGKGFRISAYGGMFMPGIRLQGKGSPFYYSGFSMNKEFFNKKLTVSLSAQNPFWKEMKYTFETIDPSFYLKSTNFRVVRSFGINLSYRFGEMKGQIKKTQRGIRNDDIKAGENGNNESRGGN